jgi:hypothetical protein
MAANIGAVSADVPDPADEEHIDGCPCGSDIDAADATPDDQLPAASGGVAGAPRPAVNEDDIGGDHAVANAADSTADNELPAAAGGVF